MKHGNPLIHNYLRKFVPDYRNCLLYHTNVDYSKYRERQLASSEFIKRLNKGAEWKEKWLKKRAQQVKEKTEERGGKIANDIPVRAVKRDSY